MSSIKPITILLVEDDVIDCENYKNFVESREDIELIGITASPQKALEYIKTYIPNAIILDIELNNGEGSGLEILEQIKTLQLDVKPIIAITTNIFSKTVYAYAHENGADLIFYKLKNDYSPELVIKNLLLLINSSVNAKQVNNKVLNEEETLNERRRRTSNRINRELDLIGISSHLVGRQYIHDSITYILENKNGENVFLYLAKKYNKANSTIGRSIQTAIEHAWRKSSIEDLQKYYTAVVNYNTGVPTPTELVYYYVDKIKQSL